MAARLAPSCEAAHQAAVIYSLLATCKINDIKPMKWLTQMLSDISEYPANRLHTLLPGQK
jgi:transposase